MSFIAGILGACVPKYQDAAAGGGGRFSKSSKLSSINMKMPKVDQLTTTDGKTPVTGVRVLIVPVDATCPNATNLDQSMTINNISTIQQKVAKGCDYELTAALGLYDDSSKSLSGIYYAVNAPSRITAAMTKDDKISVSVSLSLTEEGRRIGLPESVPTPPSPTPPSPTPPSPTPPNPTPPNPTPPNPTPPSPTPGIPELSSSLNVTVSSLTGDLPLKNVFTKQYMMVDFSRPGCGPCVQISQQLERDSSFKSMFDNSATCTLMTVIPRDQLSDWADTIGGRSTWGARHSFEYSGSHSGFARLFNYNLSATPSFIIVDRTGRVVESAVGRLPSKMNSLCK
jgi:hypothetical protein